MLHARAATRKPPSSDSPQLPPDLTARLAAPRGAP